MTIRVKRLFRASAMALAVVAAAGALAGTGPRGAAAATYEETTGFVPPTVDFPGHGKVLRPRNASGPLATVRDFLGQKGWRSNGLASLRSTGSASLRNGESLVEIEQTAGGLPVYGARGKAFFDRSGNLLELNGAMVDADATVVPGRIQPRQALDAALGRLYPGQATSLGEMQRTGNRVVYGGDRFFHSGPTVDQVAVPTGDGTLVQGYLVELWSEQSNQLDHVLVDGDGRVLNVQHRTAEDSYLVFPQQPLVDGSQSTVNGPTPVGTPGTVPSPSGWLGTQTQYSTYIQGNNARAYLDRDNNNAPDTASTVISNGTFAAVASLSSAPTTTTNQAVAVQNLFYLNNRIHDRLYGYGFTEAMRNFQVSNFSRGGSQNDPVLAEAQDGGGTNNANFATPNDGSSPRMQMYLWTRSTPNRDGDLDGDIVWHEYGHGLTWRIVNNMSGIFGGAIGEGASDSIAIIEYNNDVVGEYAYNNPNGIRTAPYGSYANTGRTYESICSGGCEVHRDGELFAAIMWNMWTQYRDTLGGDPRTTLMTDFVEGLKRTTYQCNQPTYPTFRDGILKAISGNADPTVAPTDAGVRNRWCYAWKAYAKYGVGTDQTTSCTSSSSGTSWTWFNGFQVPAACTGGGGITNNPPVASSKSVSTPQGKALAITLNAADPDSDPLTYSYTNPAHGTLTGTAPNLTYTPVSSYSGSDSFTFTAKDSKGATSNTATISITVTPTTGATTMTIASLTNSSSRGAFSWTAAVTITIKDNLGQLVSGATVSGSWSGGVSGSGSCTTSTAGSCKVSKSGLGRRVSSVTFTVSNVTKSGLTWDAVKKSLAVTQPSLALSMR
jgi:hypothetical protein